MQQRYDVCSAYKSDSPLHNTQGESKGNTKGLLLVFRNSPPTTASLLFHFPLLYTG